MKLSKEQREDLYKKSQAGHSRARLSNSYGVSLPTVDRWIKEGGKKQPNWSDAPRSGRPLATTHAERGSIKRSAKRDKSVAEIRAGVGKKRAKPVSSSTIRRLLKGGRKSFSYEPLNWSDVLRPPNKQKRLAFCTDNLRANHRHWVFLDAKKHPIPKSPHGHHQRGWQQSAKGGVPRGSGNPWVFQFYAAVAHGHKSKLHFVSPSPAEGSKARKSKGTMDSAEFEAVMTELMAEVETWYPAGREFYIIRDRATPHTSAFTNRAMTRLKVPLKQDFPPQSWDLNVIENVWGVFNQKMQGKHATTSDGWRKKIKQAWDEVEQDTINKLVAQVPGRMQQIIKAEGGWIFKKGQKQRV